jgi:hypothetical protein
LLRIHIHVSKKEFAASRRQPFDKTSNYITGIKNAGSEKLALLIKIVGMLLQTKVYLFWSQQLLVHALLHRCEMWLVFVETATFSAVLGFLALTSTAMLLSLHYPP